MKCITWNKDSHGLFDYESKSITVKKCRINASSKIYRNSNCKFKILTNPHPKKKKKNYNIY